MREHEVPTHVQAEDKVLLWFTFPQVVAVVATCAVAYGVYRYFPFGPSEFRLAIAVLLGVLGIAMTVVKVGGRGLPLVAADLLKFNLGARRYAGVLAQLARSEAPPQPDTKPDPLRVLARKAVGSIGKAAKAARNKARAPFRPHNWFGKRRPSGEESVNVGNAVRPNTRETRGKKPPHQVQSSPWYKLMAVAGLLTLALVALPGTALADDPDDEDPGWRLGEIYFEPPDPVPGRRIYIERIAVSGNTAAVSLRAAHDLDLKVRVFGGRAGRTLKMGDNAVVHSGERKTYNLSLDGPEPSFTFSWTDALGFSGAASLKSNQIPYPLPKYDGGLCDLEVVSLEWTPGAINGVIASECIAETRQEVNLPVYGGHFSQSVSALLDASVASIAGTVNVQAGTPATSAALVPGGETLFWLTVPDRKATHDLKITADLAATLNVPLPPMLQTTHYPGRTDVYTRRVTCRCGESTTVKTVRIYVHHPEHVRAVENQRAPVTHTRPETLPLVQSLGVGADNPFRYLTVPPPKPPPPRAEQTEAGDSSWLGWPW